jgi:hypothetical protein
MAARRVIQLPWFAAGFAGWCGGVGFCVASTAIHPGGSLRHPAVTASAGFTVGWMLIAWGAMLLRAPRFARFAWTLGVLTLALHLVLAFWLAHGWSHAAAVEHVREVGGFGWGIVVNYLFAAVWLTDVIWWWAKPAGHANRPRWVGWAIHGFLFAVMVNATVVFGPPEHELAYAVLVAILAVSWYFSSAGRNDNGRDEPGRSPEP